LPWSSLGLKRDDPWGHAYQYRVNNALSASFSLSTSGTGSGQIKICVDATCTKTEASNVAFVVYSRAEHDATQPPSLSDEKENADNDNIYVSHTPVQGGFDDQLAWVSYYVLMNRMIIVDKLH